MAILTMNTGCGERATSGVGSMTCRGILVARVRVYELAKEHQVSSVQVLLALGEMGESVRSASSQVDAVLERRLRQWLLSHPWPVEAHPRPGWSEDDDREAQQRGYRSGGTQRAAVSGIGSPRQFMRRRRFEPASLDPCRYRAGVEEVGRRTRVLEGGDLDREIAVPNSVVVHAEWTMRPRRPPMRLYAVLAGERHEAWCGARLRLILPKRFDASSVRACPDCLQAFERGYPVALAQP